MTTVQTQRNRVYLFRLRMLIVDGGLLVLRHILDQKLRVRNISFSDCLRHERPKIIRLKEQKAITQLQYDLLYPLGTQPPSTSDLNITLVICLLRNLTTLGLNQTFNWEVTPRSGDTSMEADMCRLKHVRHEVAQISTKTGIKLVDFRFKWTEIERIHLFFVLFVILPQAQVETNFKVRPVSKMYTINFDERNVKLLILLRLNSEVPYPLPNLQGIFDDFKVSSLDQETEERINQIIDEWKEMETISEIDGQVPNSNTLQIQQQRLKRKEHLKDTQRRVACRESHISKHTEGEFRLKKNVEDVKGLPVAQELNTVKTVIRKSWKKLIDYMIPDPILDCATEYNLLCFRDVRDIKEEKKTSEKNRGILNKVRFHGAVGYNNLKKCLEKTNQELLVDLLKCIESGEDTRVLENQIHAEMVKSRHKIFKDLKEDLVIFYRQQYNTLPLSPMIEEEDSPLLRFYVMPDISSVEIERSLGGGSETKSRVTSLRHAFYKKGKLCRAIYLTADTGLGKTAFSKRLVLTWCQAHAPITNEEDYFEKEDIRVMSTFDFVFMLSLRDCSKECDIDDMIMKHIIPLLAHTSVTLRNLETILSKEKCLVILDGLDEWTHPISSCTIGPSDVPHSKARESTILTTTRPWKLSVIHLSFSKIDKKLELVGLNEESADELKRRVISLLSDKNDHRIEENIREFNSAVLEKDISNLEPNPLLLMYLLCLWCDGTQLGRSKCEVYCQIIELLLKRTFKKYPHITPTRDDCQSGVPQCFNTKTNCKRHFTLLKVLGKLAFETLFSETRETILAFDSAIAEECLPEDILDFSRRSGILTQDTDRQRVTQQPHKTSFTHKTVHEFFAALYISITSNQDKVLNRVLSFCNSITSILDMSNIFIFNSGIDANKFTLLSKNLMKVINKDKITIKYRSMSRLYDYRTYIQPIKDIQDMYISCIHENPDNNELKLSFQDFIIDRDCHEDNYYKQLQRLVMHNKDSIKSMCIKIGIHSLQEVFYSFAPFDLGRVDKIYYEGDCKELDLILLLSQSVKCVTLISSGWVNNTFIGEFSLWPPKLSKTFRNMHQLEAINIDCFKVNHDMLGEFLNLLRNRKSMKEILLYCLVCTDHGVSCDGFNFDLSQHSDLRTLALNDIPLSNLTINLSSLEDCDVGQLSKPGLVPSYLKFLPAARKLYSFSCGQLKSSCDIDTMLQTLPLLDQVKEFRFSDIDLGERSLSLTSDMVDLKNVQLDEVKMSSSSLRALVKVVEKLPQSVTVGIKGCHIKPEKEFDEVKQYIQQSVHFEITFDGINPHRMYSLVFESFERLNV